MESNHDPKNKKACSIPLFFCPPPPREDTVADSFTFSSFRLKVLAAAALCSLTLTAQAFDFSVVAYTGKPAVGAPSGTYSNFSPHPALGDDGKVCYYATISGETPGDPGNGLWLGDAAGTQAILLGGLNGIGDPAPDTAAGTTFVNIINEKIVANGVGQAAFLASVDPPDTTSPGLRGIWAGSPNNLHLVALQGQPAPGTSSTFSGSLDYIVLNDAGQIAFGDRFEGNARYGLWMGLPGALQAVVLKGEQAPGFASGVTINGPSQLISALNDNGQMAFNSGLSTAKKVIYVGSANNIVPVAVTGQSAPGTSDTFNDLSYPADINDNGEIGFLASLLPSNTEGIFFGAPNNLALVARRGTTSPDLPAGFEIKSFSAWPIINDHNQVVFLANDGITTNISGPNLGLWIATSGALELIAREGGQPPGFPAGTAFAQPENIHLNNRGQVAFDGGYRGTPNGTAIFATDGTSTPQLVAKVGDQVLVGGVLKTFSDVSLFIHSNGAFGRLVGSSDGRPSSFNDSGDLMFNVSFAGGGSAIIKTNIPAVPTNTDTDGDGVPDASDNCTRVANADQRDTDTDGYGNRCDGDFNNDNAVNSLDLGLFKQRFLTANADADLNGDGTVNSLDLGLFKGLFLKPPGPSGVVR